MSLKNTEDVIGCVVYTGHDTKIQKNNAKRRYKMSRLMKITNKQIIMIFIAQFILSSIGSLMGSSWMIANLDLHYLKFDKTDEWNTNWGLQFFKTTCTWVLIFT